MSLLILNTLLLAILAGQLIKVPISAGSGVTVLDLVVGLLCLIGLAKSKFRLNRPPNFLLGGLAFVGVALLSLLLSPLHLSGFERLTSFFYIIRFFAYLLLGWLIYDDIIPVKARIQKILILSGVLLSILGLLQLIFLPNLEFLESFGWDPHYFRTVSTFLDPNFLGAYLVLTMQSLSWSRLPQPFLGFAMTVTYLTSLTTFSRGAYLAFLVSFMVLSYLKKSAKLAMLTIILFSGLMLGFWGYEHLVATPRGVDRIKSAESRLTTWQQGLTLFQNHPILGVGFNAYRYALKEYKLADERFIKSHGSSSNDSSLLFVAATTGVLGLLSYLFFLGTLAWHGFKKNPILLAGLLGLMAQSFFANTLFYPPLLLWIILIAMWTREDSNF